MARAIGINHVALEVGDIDEALAFYGRILEFTLRGRGRGMAFIDMGDQFIALAEGRRQASDDGRHFGLVVDDLEAVRGALRDAGVAPLPGRGLDFMDPWATACRSSTTARSSSRRPRRCSRRWGSPISARARPPCARWTPRGSRRAPDERAPGRESSGLG
jgi:catechol 2,3-dioxygenase-like lactoylglutathione lyase family enzyme